MKYLGGRLGVFMVDCLEFPAEYCIWIAEVTIPKTRVKGEFVKDCS